MKVKKCSIDPKGQQKRVKENNANVVRIVKRLKAWGSSQADICDAIDCYTIIV